VYVGNKPELVSDIHDNGVVLIGGGTLIQGFDQLLSESTGVVCKYAEEPASCVVLGTDKLFKSPKLFKSIFLGREKQVLV